MNEDGLQEYLFPAGRECTAMKTTKNILFALITLAASAFVLCGCNNITDNSPNPEKKNPAQVQANKKE